MHSARQRASVVIAILLAFSASYGCSGASDESGTKQWALTEVGAVNGIGAGPDGRMWFVIAGAKAIGAIDADGNIQMYQNAINIDADGERIAAGPDGALWLTQVNPHAPVDSGPDLIGRITTQGKWAEYPIASWDALPLGIAAGPDGAMWFAERHANAIGKITMSGKIREFPLPHSDSGPTAITRGTDGRMWFSETDGDRIGAIDPATAEIVEYTVPIAKSKPGPIAPGAGGELYFIELAKHDVAGISTKGIFARLSRRSNKNEMTAALTGALAERGAPVDIAEGSDHATWVAYQGGAIDRMVSGNVIASTDAGNGMPSAIAIGRGGTVWFAERKGPTFSYTGTAGIGLLTASEHR